MILGSGRNTDWPNVVFTILYWGFLSVFTILLIVAFAMALSRLGDGGVIGVGVVALAACVIAVTIQGLQVRSLIDARDARSISDPWNFSLRRPRDILDVDRFAIRSYSLIVCPDLMQSIQGPFASKVDSSYLTEKQFISCTSGLTRGQVSYASDATFLVIAQGAASTGFLSDVVDGRVSSIMLSGTLMRIVSLSGIDIAGDTANVVSTIAQDHDIYMLSARSVGGVVSASDSAHTGCSAVPMHMPWSDTNSMQTTTAQSAIAALGTGVQAGTVVHVQVWGIGAR